MKIKYIGPRRRIMAYNILFYKDVETEVTFAASRRLLRNRYFVEVKAEPKVEPKKPIQMTVVELKAVLDAKGIEYPEDVKRPELVRLVSGN